ncbi:Hypothetical predicted protein [Octopus vulgaris]|uniref:ILCR1 Ig-like domain-containing protein n=1 Tax=Octopus vulgaris TaxID=6645 RepID=A0AA36BAA0_OCTVU|nr:Hypothetical predicted protein [Octopus vulgaris]
MKPDKVKTSMFLTCIGSKGRDIHSTLDFDSPDEEMNLQTVIEKFDAYCEPRKNITFLRHKFFTCGQAEHQKFDEYVVELRQKAQQCEFGNLTDSLTKDILICGIRDMRLRERLLREPNLDLQKTIQAVCKSFPTVCGFAILTMVKPSAKDTMERFLTAFILTLLFIHNSAVCPKPKYIEPYYLYQTDCCQEDLDVFKPFPNGKYPEKPKILELTDFLRNEKRGIKAVWNANLTHLKGFKIEYEFKDSGKKICRILDFSKFLRKNKSISNHNFEFEIHPVRKNKELLVHLHPLPESGNNYPPAQEVDTFMCREWLSEMDYSLKDDMLIVQFKQGPSKCNIKMYNLTLYDGQSRILKEAAVNSSKTLSKLKHKFHGLCPGTYEISF